MRRKQGTKGEDNMKSIWLGMKVIVDDIKEVGAIYDPERDVWLPLIAVNEPQRDDIAAYIQLLTSEDEEGGKYTIDRFEYAATEIGE